MAATPEQTSLAADPSTDAQTLADLAHAEPALWPAIAVHPNVYPGLIDWMHENGLADAAVSSDAPTDSLPPVTTPTGAAASVWPEAPAARNPLTLARLKIPLIAAAAGIVVVALVLGGMYAYSAFIQAHGTGLAGGSPSSASDYRFGAKQTWQTKVNVVATPSQGFASYYAGLQQYPGLWLVHWPGDDSGSGRLTNETVLAMDPSSGAVKWSLSPWPYQCADTLASGALACVNSQKASLAVLDPSSGKAIGSSLNGVQANSVQSYQNDMVVGDESTTSAGTVDTLERVKLDGTVVWKKSATCTDSPSDGGMQFLTAGEMAAMLGPGANMKPNEARLQGVCLQGLINLDSGAVTASQQMDTDSCLQSNIFDDADGTYFYGTRCGGTKYPVLVPRGSSTLTAVAESEVNLGGSGSTVPTLWSADLAGAALNWGNNEQNEIAHLGSYALVASAGHLYGIDTATGPRWEQANAFSGASQVVLLPIDSTKPNTPVLALDGEHHTIERLDPGFGAARVSTEPAALPSCPNGTTPVSFSTWAKGTGATLVCQGFGSTVTVVLIVDGKTYTSTTGSITPTGYYADFGSGVSVDIGLGGWAVWVGNSGTPTLHAAASGWQLGDVRAQAYPALAGDIQACPAGSYPLSLSTWNGGWLLTCGVKASSITRFVYVDGSAHGSGRAMTAQGGQSCGTDSQGREVCVSANPAVVGFSSKGGSQTQHSVDANYVAGKGFSGAGKGTGAYGLADPVANAASEVAYLNGILQQSQAARSSIRTVVQNILKCASVQADVQSAQAVAAARTTELQALNSAPVDAVPGGLALVAQLRGVLQDSLTADQAYVTAASQVASGQCAAGKSTYNAQIPLIAQITSEKAAFTNSWNGQISSQYGTPTYTQADI